MVARRNPAAVSQHGGVSTAPALGGASRPVIPPSADATVNAAAWSTDGRAIAFVRADSLLVTPVEGGTPRLIGTSPGLHSCSLVAQWKLDRLCDPERRVRTSGHDLRKSGTQRHSACFRRREALRAVCSRQRRSTRVPIWSPDGEQLFFLSNRDGPRDVYAIGISSSGRPKGGPARLTTGLGAISISLSGDGRRLGYAVYSARANIWSLPIPSGATVTPDHATSLTSGSQVIESMRVSPDGRWLLFDSDLRGNSDI